LMKQAIESGMVDARPIPLRSLQQCAGTLPVRPTTLTAHRKSPVTDAIFAWRDGRHSFSWPAFWIALHRPEELGARITTNSLPRDRHLRLRSALRPRRNPARDGFAGLPHGKLGPGDCRRSRCVALDPVGSAVVGPGRADIRRAGRVCWSHRPARVSGSDGDDRCVAGAGARNWSASSEKAVTFRLDSTEVLCLDFDHRYRSPWPCPPRMRPRRAGALVSALDVPGQAVPNAADAGHQLRAMAERPNRKAGRIDESVNNASKRPARSIRAELIQPKIK